MLFRSVTVTLSAEESDTDTDTDTDADTDTDTGWYEASYTWTGADQTGGGSVATAESEEGTMNLLSLSFATTRPVRPRPEGRSQERGVPLVKGRSAAPRTSARPALPTRPRPPLVFARLAGRDIWFGWRLRLPRGRSSGRVTGGDSG